MGDRKQPTPPPPHSGPLDPDACYGATNPPPQRKPPPPPAPPEKRLYTVDKITELGMAAIAAIHLCESLLACREGPTDELIKNIRDKLKSAVTAGAWNG